MKKTKPAKARQALKGPDLYQQVTDRIVAAIEKGTLPWRKPWTSPVKSATSPIPVNAHTGRAYQGVNVLLLWLSADERGFISDRWLTYRQAQDMGGQVRKGEIATQAVIYKSLEYQAKDTHDAPLFDDKGNPVLERRAMLKSLTLFNVAQCDDLPASAMGGQAVPLSAEDTDAPCAPVINQIVRMLSATGVKANSFRQGRAYYRPLTDEIVMPTAEQFFTDSDYWATLLHELVHATGHQKRLNREGITSSSRQFGDPIYAFEELIAEMGSAFLCATLGIYGEVQHDSYIDHWLSVLKADKRALFRACRFSREAADFLLQPLNAEANQVA